jgi:hypothetical protein
MVEEYMLPLFEAIIVTFTFATLILLYICTECDITF